MDLLHLHTEILLRIIEFLDLATIHTLRRIDKFKSLMNQYEISIVRSIYQISYRPTTGLTNGPFLPVYDLGVQKGTASHASGWEHLAQHKLRLLFINTFTALEEIERRNKAIVLLLSSPSSIIQANESSYTWPHLPDMEVRTRLSLLLERAFHQSDVFADMVGLAAAYICGESSSSLAEVVSGVVFADEQRISKLARQFQIEYLENLSLESLIELYFLGILLGENRWFSSGLGNSMETTSPAGEHIFHEMVLRYGSWVVCGEGPSHKIHAYHRQQLFHQTHLEMKLLTDDAVLGSHWNIRRLRIALHFLLRERLNIGRLGGLRKQIYNQVEVTIGAYGAFDNPPPLGDHFTWCPFSNPWWWL